MNKKKTIIITVTSVLFLAVIGITYAWFSANVLGNENASNVVIKSGALGILYQDGQEINLNNAMPGNSVSKTFTVTNTTDSYTYYSIEWVNIVNNFVDKSELVYKLELIDNNTSALKETIKEAEAPSSDITIKDAIRLEGKEVQTYKLTITFKNLATNQNYNQGKTFSGKINVNGEISENETPTIIVEKEDNMIAIMWNGSSWVKADETNSSSTYKWYDYDAKQWANVVVVNNPSTYQSATVGTVIPETDIKAYFVYVPRYKYKLFNAENGTSEPQTIEVEFETKTTARSTGTTNGNWLTHPAFCFGRYDESTGACDGTETNGIWVGKFETSYGSFVTGTTTSATALAAGVYVKPNQYALRRMTVSEMYNTALSLKGSSYYNIPTMDSHVMKNMEWGATAYLSHSNYGSCTNGICKEVQLNSYYVSSSDRYKTGCGPQTDGGTGSGSTCNAYTTEIGKLSSTTQNIYGIYDMSGGSYDYVMGNMVDNTGAFYPRLAGTFTPNPPLTKYYDSYAYGETNTDATAFARGKLGDATRETLTAINGGTSGWYSDSSFFVYLTTSWFLRGGDCSNGANAGLFNFIVSDGSAIDSNSWRLVLAK